MSYISTGAVVASKGLSTSGPRVGDPVTKDNMNTYQIWWVSLASKDSTSKRTTYGPGAMLQHGYGMKALSAADLENWLAARHGALGVAALPANVEAYSRVVIGELREVATGKTVCKITRTGYGGAWQTVVEFPGEARTEVSTGSAGVRPDGTLIGQSNLIVDYITRLSANAGAGNAAARQQLDVLSANSNNAGYQQVLDAAKKAADEAQSSGSGSGSSSLLLYGAVGIGVLALIFILKRRGT